MQAPNPFISFFETQDGSLSVFSDHFRQSYHSKYGAVKESSHVFIQEGLQHMAVRHKDLSIFEVGMGTGLNVYLTALRGEQWQLNIHYETVESHPIREEWIDQFNYPTFCQRPEKDPLFKHIHLSPWDEAVALTERVTFVKHPLAVEDFKTDRRFHIIYFDAFAPSTQAYLWETPIFQQMYDLLLPGGVLVTYCAKGVVKRAMRACGFEVESPQGPPGKREMIRAIRPN